jgi:hypothetical protein
LQCHAVGCGGGEDADVGGVVDAAADVPEAEPPGMSQIIGSASFPSSVEGEIVAVSNNPIAEGGVNEYSFPFSHCNALELTSYCLDLSVVVLGVSVVT